MYLYLATLVFFIISVIKSFHRSKKHPPSPPAFPVIGHLHLIKLPIQEALESLLIKYGPIVSLKLGCKSILLLSSPSAVEECFTKNDIIFADRPRSTAADHFSYNYTMPASAPYGNFWRRQRRLTVVELFSQQSLQGSSVVREEEVRFLLCQLLKMSNHGSQKVDLSYCFSLLMFNIMMRTVTGRQCVDGEIACTEKGNKLIKELRDTFLPRLMLTVCDFLPILRWVGFKGIENSLIQFQMKRNEFMQKIIDEERKMDKSKNGTSLIKTMLALQEEEPEFYTDNILKSIIVVLLVAGRDTTEATLEWAMALLLNHPVEMKRLRTEIDNVVGQGRLLNELDLPNLPYLRCVINEAHRLYPPAPMLVPHLSTENCTIGEYEISRGTILMVNAWAMHRDPKLWTEPTKFMPARFESGEVEKQGFKYIPFGLGRRACPGTSMAMRATMLALGLLIQAFEWERTGKEMVDMSVRIGSTLHKAKPLEAVCRPRLLISNTLG